MSDVLSDLRTARDLLDTIWQRYRDERKQLKASIEKLAGKAGEIATTLHPGDLAVVHGRRYAIQSIRLEADERMVRITARKILVGGVMSVRNSHLLEPISDVRRYHAPLEVTQ